MPASGSHHMLMSGDSGFYNVVATLNEMDRVEKIFECLRIQLNSMDIRFPHHSVFPQVLALMETTVVLEKENQKKEFAENLKTTVETIMPWNQFLSYSGVH